MAAARSSWIHVPVAQQAGGTWLHDVLQQRRCSAAASSTGDMPRQRIEVVRSDDPEARVDELFRERGWTDGLPVVAPTMARVAEMLRCSPLPAGASLGELGPLNGVATVEKVAANAVMAGCRPEYFPVVLAAVRGISEPAFNLRGMQMTDENATPLVIVSGPVAAQLGISGGIGALGPGRQANATIGRALRLAMINIGGGVTGVTSLAGIAQPGRYTLCVAEHPTASPWPPLHTESGLPADRSAVTLLRAESSINVTGDLDDIASAMGSAVSAFTALHGGCVAALLAPATVKRAIESGLDKQAIARYLFEHGRIPLEQWRRMWVRRHIVPSYGAPSWVRQAEDEGRDIPVVERPSDIVLFVAGGDAPIAQQVYFPSWGFPYCRVVRPIELPRDWAPDPSLAAAPL